MSRIFGYIFTVIFILTLIVFAGCGAPKIDIDHVNFQEPHDEMIPATYLIGRGDEMEILYYIDPEGSLSEYLIDTEERLKIELYYYPALNKSVHVRPDGFITLQRIGDVKAIGKTPKELAAEITKLYAPFFKRPDATVEVIEFNVKMENLKTAIKTTTHGQWKQVFVRPDGQVSLPYIKDMLAEGFTCRQLSQALEEEYRKFVKNVKITVSMLHAHSNRAYIMGEIDKPNFYRLPGTITLTQLVAVAGGFSSRANTHQILLIRRAKDGRPAPRLIDMDNILGKGDLTEDPIINQYDVVYVPKTRLTEAALVMESIWQLIPLRFSGNYSLE